MIKYFFILIFCIAILAEACAGQEIQAKVTVVAQQIGTNVDRTIFNTLQTQLTNLINNRKWTSETYQPQEKIQCNFLLNVTSVVADNEYKATLTVQAARPVYNSIYQSALINYQDPEVTFSYTAYQPIDFNENNVQGTDPLMANLSATIAYYVYMILGFEHDSFAPKGGDAYFQQAENIVTNAPDQKDISGWKSFDGLRNRYWLAENMTNAKYNVLHDVLYKYYRSGLDSMYDEQNTAQQNVLEALSTLVDFNHENANTMALQFFIQGKSDELIGVFQPASPMLKTRALQFLTQLDVSNITKYQSALH